ncbi:hypothetical protein M9Y10_019644 [Tritrichomonas musculus]|uniref:Uncharacterized protein n=1 Tax=Tritrichomonas musculus TaxID=1915356 RepID=A0ABR2HIZ7_9EUKA
MNNDADRYRNGNFDFNNEEMLNLADNRKSRCMKEDCEFLHFPKLWGDRLVKHRASVEEDFNSNVKKMIELYNSAQNSDNLGKHSRMLLREGLISKVTLTLRSTMRKLFRVPRSNKKRVYRARSLELPIQLRPATKFADGIELENFPTETISTNVN